MTLSRDARRGPKSDSASNRYSASADRVFSILKSHFTPCQNNALHDYVQVRVMLECFCYDIIMLKIFVFMLQSRMRAIMLKIMLQRPTSLCFSLGRSKVIREGEPVRLCIHEL